MCRLLLNAVLLPIPKSHGNILQGGAASFCALALKKYDGSSALPYQTERHVFEDPS